MKLKEIAEAYPALMKLSASDMPYQTANKLYKLITDMRVHIEFYQKHHLEIFKKYGAYDEKTRNYSANAGDKNFYKITEEKSKLSDTDIDFEAAKIDVPAPEKISAGEIGALMPFIKFVEKSDTKTEKE